MTQSLTQPPAGPGITQGTAGVLRSTKPWVLFISVLLWVAVGLMLLFAGFMLIAGTAGMEFGEISGAEGVMLALALPNLFILKM